MAPSICTIFTDSHLPQALTLWDSIRQQSSAWRFVALRIGDGPLGKDVPVEFVDSCIGIHDLVDLERGQLFWYEPFELCNALKAPLHDYMWRQSGSDEWWYVDGDCVFLQSPDCLNTVPWGEVGIMFSPHRSGNDGYDAQVDLDLLTLGSFNGGLLGLRRCSDTHMFIDWFKNRLTWHAFNDPALGLFVDQRWLDVGCGYFPCAMVRDRSINVGHWNYADWHGADTNRIALLHCSQLDIVGHVCRVLRYPRNRATHEAYDTLMQRYANQIMMWRERVGPPRSYPFGAFRDGRPVTRAMRRSYYCEVREGCAPEDPFLDSNRYASLDLAKERNRFATMVTSWNTDWGRNFLGVQAQDIPRIFPPDAVLWQYSIGQLSAHIGARIRARFRT